MDLTEISLILINFLFKLYLSVGRVVLGYMAQLTRRLVIQKMEGYGLVINGPNPIDPQVKDERLYIRSALEGETGMYDSYVEGYWSSRDLVGTFARCMLSRRTRDILHPLSWTLQFFNLQKGGRRVWQVGEEHYDVGNEVYEAMLGSSMQYTCAYWEREGGDARMDLDTAQKDKMKLIGEKLQLRKGMVVLDIGCGFGTLAHYLSINYGVRVVGCSISKEQTKYGRDVCARSGLDVEFLICDYRELLGQELPEFDRIVSVGMFEHVGPHNYAEFFRVVHTLLKEDGLFLLHTIGNNHPTMPCVSVWLHRHIFPNGVIPYYLDLCRGLEGLFIIEDWQNFSHDYSKTIQCWRRNFEGAWRSGALKGNLHYGERFYRIWTVYLSLAEAAFVTRSFQLWQLVLSKDGVKGGYRSRRLLGCSE